MKKYIRKLYIGLIAQVLCLISLIVMRNPLNQILISWRTEHRDIESLLLHGMSMLEEMNIGFYIFMVSFFFIIWILSYFGRFFIKTGDDKYAISFAFFFVEVFIVSRIIVRLSKIQASIQFNDFYFDGEGLIVNIQNFLYNYPIYIICIIVVSVFIVHTLVKVHRNQ